MERTDSDHDRTLLVAVVVAHRGQTRSDSLSHSLGEAYRAVLLAHGMEALILPAPTSAEAIEQACQVVNGVLLTGGPDVDPALYGQEPRIEPDTIHRERDDAEIALVREAERRGLPLLAICRGIQVLNVALGGSLIQDIPSETESIVPHQNAERDLLAHAVRLEPTSRLAAVLGDTEPWVNSMHHQAILQPASSLRVVGTVADGIIEAVEGAGERFVVGVQWHPEELVASTEHARRLFAAFAAACRAYQPAG